MAKKKEGVRATLSKTAITSHSYNRARTLVAVCDSTPDVKIYKVDGTDSKTWTLEATLVAVCSTPPPRSLNLPPYNPPPSPQHDMNVLSVDWGPKTNRIVSCSEDRTAYVWTEKKGKWEQELVVLGPACTYAGLVCKWCESEEKFAVGTGSSQTHVCYYDEANNWWMSKAAKGHASSVTAVAWMAEAEDLILATASTDGRVNLVSGYVKPVDGKIENPGKVGTVIKSHKLKSWVHSIAFRCVAAFLFFSYSFFVLRRLFRESPLKKQPRRGVARRRDARLDDCLPGHVGQQLLQPAVAAHEGSPLHLGRLCGERHLRRRRTRLLPDVLQAVGRQVGNSGMAPFGWAFCCLQPPLHAETHAHTFKTRRASGLRVRRRRT